MLVFLCCLCPLALPACWFLPPNVWDTCSKKKTQGPCHSEGPCVPGPWAARLVLSPFRVSSRLFCGVARVVLTERSGGEHVTPSPREPALWHATASAWAACRSLPLSETGLAYSLKNIRQLWKKWCSAGVRSLGSLLGTAALGRCRTSTTSLSLFPHGRQLAEMISGTKFPAVAIFLPFLKMQSFFFFLIELFFSRLGDF